MHIKKILNYINTYLTSQSSKACISLLIFSVISERILVLISSSNVVAISGNWEYKKSRSKEKEDWVEHSKCAVVAAEEPIVDYSVQYGSRPPKPSFLSELPMFLSFETYFQSFMSKAGHSPFWLEIKSFPDFLNHVS